MRRPSPGAEVAQGPGAASPPVRSGRVRFVLDLLWLLPGLLLACGGVGVFAAVIATAAAASNGGNDATGVFFLTIITAFLRRGFCLALFVGLLSTIFAPLMYQSVVAGRRGLGAAIGEGWRMAKANLGSLDHFCHPAVDPNSCSDAGVAAHLPVYAPLDELWMQNLEWGDGFCQPRHATADAAVWKHGLAVGRHASFRPPDVAHLEFQAELPVDAIRRGLSAFWGLERAC